jgi:hypothetical protein
MSYSFAGTTGNYLTAAHHANYDFTGDFTMAFWAKQVTPVTETKMIMSKTLLNGSDGDILLMLYSTGRFAVSINSTTTSIGFATSSAGPSNNGTVTDNGWHHYACVRSGSTVTLYIDGVADTTTGTLSGLLSVTAACPILLGNVFPGVNTADFSGLISQPHVYNTALSALQVGTIMSAPGTYTTGLIGYWPLTPSGATGLDDASATANDMVATGATHSATEPTAPPAAPTSVAGTAGDATVTVTWTNSVTSGVTAHKVYRRLTSGSYSTSLATVNMSTALYVDNTAANNSVYRYMVRAYNGTSTLESGNSTETADMAPVSGAAAPAAPTALTATAGSNQVTLNWTLASPATGIVAQHVYRSQVAGVYSTVLAAGSALSNTATTFTDTTAANGTLYYYVVRSFSTLESANSNQVSSTPVSGTVSAAPTNFVATPGDGLVSFFWTRSASAGITQQRIYRASSAGAYGAVGTQIITINDNVTQIATDTAAPNGSTFFYVIRSFNGVNESSDSVEQGPIAPSVDAPPLPPTNLTGVSGNGRIFLTWTPSTTPLVSQQLVYRALASGVYGSPLATIADNVTSTYTDDTAANGVPYYYVVRAAY